MIQNYLVFCIDGSIKYVSGSIPSGKLVANDVNRNSIWVISPFYPTGIVRASYQVKNRVIEQVSSTGILRNDRITVDELVPKSASYYKLVKDWNIWEMKVPQRVLAFISHHRLGDIGISFEFRDYSLPPIPEGISFVEDILEEEFVPTEDGYYTVKLVQYTYDETTYHFNDVLVKVGENIYKLNRRTFVGNTTTVNYAVDPSIPADNYETVEPTLTDDILSTLNEHGVLIENLNVNQGVKENLPYEEKEQAEDNDAFYLYDGEPKKVRLNKIITVEETTW